MHRYFGSIVLLLCFVGMLVASLSTHGAHSTPSPLNVPWNRTITTVTDREFNLFTTGSSGVLTSWFFTPGNQGLNHTLYAFWNFTMMDQTTGATKWTIQGNIGPLCSYNHDLLTITTSSDSDHLAFIESWQNCGSNDYTSVLRVYETKTGSQLWNHTTPQPYYHPNYIQKMAFVTPIPTSDSSLPLLVLADQKNLFAHYAHSGELVYEIQLPFPQSKSAQIFLEVTPELAFVGRSVGQNNDGSHIFDGDGSNCSIFPFHPANGRILSQDNFTCSYIRFMTVNLRVDSDGGSAHLMIAGMLPRQQWNTKGNRRNCLIEKSTFDLKAGKSSIQWSYPYNCSGDFPTSLAFSSRSTTHGGYPDAVTITQDPTEEYGNSNYINMTKISTVNASVIWTKGPFLSNYPIPYVPGTWYNEDSFLVPVENKNGIIFYALKDKIVAADGLTGNTIAQVPGEHGGWGGGIRLADDGLSVICGTTWNGSVGSLCRISL